MSDPTSSARSIASVFDRARAKRVLCLVDGQHYPSVIAASIRQIADQGATIAGVLFLGGTEKIEDPRRALEDIVPSAAISIAPDRGEQDLENRLGEVLSDLQADVVVDLSDAPVQSYARRYRLVTRALADGAAYLGADFAFEPPGAEAILTKPSVAIVGTDKRIGKTAVSIHIAKLLRRDGRHPIVVTMGRGGPDEPELILPEGADPVERLLAVAESGKHAASDYWEDSALSEVPTVGCRRCGGGLFGAPFDSNVAAGVALAESRDEDVVIVEGSGPTAAPVRTDLVVLVSSAAGDPAETLDGLARYRLLKSDVVVLTGCQPPFAREDSIARMDGIIRRERGNLPVFHTTFEPEPTKPIEGAAVFLAVTADPDAAGELAESLERRHGCRVAHTSTALSDREALRRDLDRGLDSCDVLVTEVKAASIDVAAQAARERGKGTVLMHNALAGEEAAGFDRFLLDNLAPRSKT